MRFFLNDLNFRPDGMAVAGPLVMARLDHDGMELVDDEFLVSIKLQQLGHMASDSDKAKIYICFNKSVSYSVLMSKSGRSSNV
jgi:hypothetical protein